MQSDSGTNGARSDTVRVAVTQAEPEWLDLEKSVNKTCNLIKEAAQNGAKLVTFPEVWIPGYPAWLWSRNVDMALGARYIKNSLKVKSVEMERICSCAAENSINVCLGFSENDNDSLYIAQSIIANDGTIKMTRRKIKATHMERTVFGDASGDCLRNVVETNIGRIGALACWEHVQPLLKYHTYLLREAIHVSAWPPVFDHDDLEPGLWSMSKPGIEALSRTYAIESQSFVLHTNAVITAKGIQLMSTENGIIMNRPGGGCSAIFGPDGRKMSKGLAADEEGILYADLNLDDILNSKQFLDTCGHYSRPDMLFLGVDGRQKEHLQIHQ